MIIHNSENNVLRQEYLDAIKSYRPMDDTFMRALFRDSPELVEMFLRTVLKKPDLKVIQSETQADLKRITGSRGLCRDVVATDDSGKKYDIEVQRDISEMKPERARYHASAMDVENSWKGMEFEELPETYVIFITEKDYFERKQPIYSIQRTVHDNNSPFNDGSNILYVNGEYRDDSKFGKLMHDFNCSEAEDMLLPEMAERTNYLKTNEVEVENMCRQMQEIKERGRVEGRAEGIPIGELKKAKEIVLNLIAVQRDMSVEQLASIAGVSVDQIKEWIEEK